MKLNDIYCKELFQLSCKLLDASRFPVEYYTIDRVKELLLMITLHSTCYVAKFSEDLNFYFIHVYNTDGEVVYEYARLKI